MVRKFYEADGDNAYGFNTSSSLPSGGRTFEQILEDYHVQLEDNRRDESIKLTAEKYASQYAHQQPVQGYSEAEAIVKELAQWSKKYPRSTIYPMTNKQMDEELISIEEKANRFTSQQPVNETTPLELIDALENTMKPIYQQPVNDGWVRFINEYIEAWDNGMPGDLSLYNKAKSLIEPPKQTV